MKYFLSRSINGVNYIEFDLNNLLGKGGNASVYKEFIDGEFYAVKIFNGETNIDVDKLIYMVDNIPSNLYVEISKIKYPKYSWPIYLLYNEPELKDISGYVTPLIDENSSFTLDYFYDYNLMKKLNSSIVHSLNVKIEIIYNLCVLISELHELGHAFVDLKPQNIRVYEDNFMVSLLDCDGFLIHNSVKNSNFNGTMVTTDYISPELLNSNNKIDFMDQRQDNFALAVIIFQMLNNGIHPFQGILLDENLDASTNDDKVKLGLYPYGVIQSKNIYPRKNSIHDTFPLNLRNLFDKAFTDSINRPSAQDWVNEFFKIKSNKLIDNCDNFPDNISHIKFKNCACPVCKILSDENDTNFQPNYSIKNEQNSTYTEHNLYSQPNIKKSNTSVFVFILIGILTIFGMYFISSSQSDKSNTAIDGNLNKSSSLNNIENKYKSKIYNEANLEFCNYSNKKAYLSLAYIKEEKFIVAGWFSSDPNQCYKLGTFLKKSLFAYVIENKGNEYVGTNSSDPYICIPKKNESFEIIVTSNCKQNQKPIRYFKLDINDREYEYKFYIDGVE